jgi:MoaA/NifB/PqqE/SkfB family radical SAM enzyme
VRSLFSKERTIHLTFFVTRRCNARCPSCFYQHARDAVDAAPELSIGEIRRIARSMGGLLWVLFSGGEPFLRDDLVEISQIFHDTNDACFLTYPTNGLLPEVIAERTEEILKRCRNSVVVLKLSLDGVGADHDEVRQVPGGFDRLMDAYQRLAALAEAYPRLEIGVNTLFCPENQRRMEGIIEFVRGLRGVRSHTITMFRGREPGTGIGNLDLSHYARVMRHLDHRWRSRSDRFHRFAGGRLKAAQDRLQSRLIHRTLSHGRRLIPCYAGALNLVLTESGELHPCEGRWDRSFGNVREAGHDVGAMLRSERARRVLDEIARGDCYCSHECNFLTNILFNPAMVPGLVGEWARLGLGWPRAGGTGGASAGEYERMRAQ